MNIENATIATVNLTTGPELAATVTIRIQNPDDATLAALLAMANRPVVGTLSATEAG